MNGNTREDESVPDCQWRILSDPQVGQKNCPRAKAAGLPSVHRYGVLPHPCLRHTQLHPLRTQTGHPASPCYKTDPSLEATKRIAHSRQIYIMNEGYSTLPLQNRLHCKVCFHSPITLIKYTTANMKLAHPSSC